MKTQIWFVMLLLVILSIIPKLPLFLFWNPNFTQISNQKKKNHHGVGEEFLYTLCSFLVNCKKPKRRITVPVVVVLLSFPFLQILTNQPRNRQRRTCKENYWQMNRQKMRQIIHRRIRTSTADLTLKSQHLISLPIWFWGYRERERGWFWVKLRKINSPLMIFNCHAWG